MPSNMECIEKYIILGSVQGMHYIKKHHKKIFEQEEIWNRSELKLCLGENEMLNETTVQNSSIPAIILRFRIP